MESKWFAGRLRELRQQAGLTQQQLAEKGGMTRDGVAQIETGRNSPSWDTVVILCKALGVDCTEFAKPPVVVESPGPGRPRKEAVTDAGKPAAEKKRGPKRKGGAS